LNSASLTPLINLIPHDELRNAIGKGRDILSRPKPLPESCISMKKSIDKLLREGIISKETAEKALQA